MKKEAVFHFGLSLFLPAVGVKQPLLQSESAKLESDGGRQLYAGFLLGAGL